MKILLDRPIKNIINVHLEVSSYNLDSSIVPCDQNFNLKDCLAQARRQLPTTCMLPFESVDIDNQTFCKTDAEGYSTMQQVAKLRDTCDSRCTITNLHTIEIPLTYLTLSLKKNFLYGLQQKYKMKPGYYFSIPIKARQITVSHDYGFISWVAEFAGWSGIFVGASLTFILSTILDSNCCKAFGEKQKKIMIKTTVSISSIYIIYLLYACSSKFLKIPTGINVEFEETKTDFDFTICTPKYPFAFERTFEG